jgi:Uma2 family endonuclease
MTAAPRLLTYDDLLAQPDDARMEIVAGQLETLPAPSPRHSNVQGALRRFIGGPFHDDHGFDGPGGWWIFLEVDLELTRHDVVRPDLAGWRRERLLDPDQRPLRTAPDWVCEILSPSTSARDRTVKKRLYAAAEIGHYWLVDPDARTLEALALRQGSWVDVGSYRDGDRACVPPFEVIELEIGRLFLPDRAAES